MTDPIQPASRAKLVAAFATVYLIWGSTYLAIRFAIETLPPFLMASARFTVAGTLLFVIMKLAGAESRGRLSWRDAFVVGGLLLFGGNGGVVWAQQYIDSGIAALLVATLPIWLVVFDWLLAGGPRPLLQTVIGMLLGLVGIALLVGPNALTGASVPLMPALVVVGASMAWALGSLYSRTAHLPTAPLMGTAMQMLAGGLLLLVAGVLTGELSDLEADAISGRSLLALLYLIVMGSIIAYSAYIWLLRHAEAARVSTYAYVNPVVAVFLGWALAGEAITPRIVAAAAVIIGGVAVIVTVRGKRTSPRAASGEPPE